LSTLTYRDPQAPIDERVEHLLAMMTLDEKLAQLGCIWSTAFISSGTFDPGVVSEKIPHGIGQVTRIGASTGLLPRESAELMNAIQRVVIEQTRLGIPVILHEESTGGLSQRGATAFPQGIGLAATWDPALVKRVASVIRTQMMAVGARHALAPVLDVARDPRWGRVEESYGEDPVLAATIGTAYVQGLQGDNLRGGVAATGKHFLGYAVSEGGRNWGPVQLGPRELREIYAEPFAAVIRDARLSTIMNSYASVDGLPCAGSPAILNDLLRDELGFDGTVVADYGAVRALMDFHHVAATPGEAARLALLAGLDMELPTADCFGAPLKAEIEAGRVPVEAVDTAVRRVLRLKFELGLFENPYVDAEAAPAVFDTPEQRTLAHQAAVESIVLLTNDGVLPIAPTVKRVAVIGPGADDQRLLQGDYHYPAHQEMIYAAPPNLDSTGLIVPRAAGSYAPGPYFTPHVTPLAGLREALGTDVEVYYAKGCEVTGDSKDGFVEAVQLAEQADLAVVVVAGRSGLLRNATVGEANDATSLDLTGVQQQLVDAIADTGVPLVVVVLSGRVHTLADIARRASALLQVFPPGEEGGSSLAEVLTGKANPSGRLPVSLPRSVGQVPNHVGLRAGGNHPMFYGDYIDTQASPLFAFGHGLSYTSFAYSELVVQATTTTEPIEVSLEVLNSGARAGDEVVQLYCRDLVASVARPERILLGFARVSLAPGQARRVTFTVHPSRLAFYDPCMRFVVEPGAFTFSVGSSSASIRAEKTVKLDGPLAEYRQREIVATKTTIL
jgi:beta-glucosidase